MANIPIGWKELQLSEVLDYDQPNEYIVESEILEKETSIPVLTANKSFIKGYTKETKGIYENVPVIIFDDFTADNKFVNFPFKVKSSAMKILKLKDSKANLKFIFYQMQLIDVNTTTHKRYYLSLYQNLPFIFPVDKHGEIDLEKQQQIVDEIEKQFTRLDASVKDLKGVNNKFEIYKISVLKSAFEGLFTNVDAKKKTLDVLGVKLSISESWNTGRLSDLGEYGRGKSKHRPRNDAVLFKDGKYPFIQTGDISTANKFITNYDKTYNEIGLKQSKLWNKGTLCITIAANIAKTAILEFDACFPDSVIGFSSKSRKTTLFVMYYIQLIEQILNVKASATAQKNINLGTFTKIEFPVLNEQLREEIVNEIEFRFSVIDKLEETVDSVLDKTDQLRKSILKTAFEGKLVQEVLV